MAHTTSRILLQASPREEVGRIACDRISCNYRIALPLPYQSARMNTAGGVGRRRGLTESTTRRMCRTSEGCRRGQVPLPFLLRRIESVSPEFL